MKIIKRLSEMIDDELDGACEYAKCAVKYKVEYPELAETFYKLSGEEMGHMQILHDRVTALIKKEREEHGEPPANMLAVYDYIHEKQIERANHVRYYQAAYKES